MAGAISSNQRKDAGTYGRTQDELPPLDQGPLDLRPWFHFPPKAPGETSGGTSGGGRLELEIGAGKGTFLVGYARAHPEREVIGIEWARAYYIHGADRLRRLNLTNARMLHAEAGMFIRNYVADAALGAVHVYFPDPWPKKRHHKRRLIQTPFLHQLHRVLAPGGKIHLATDHAEYFAWMEAHVEAAGPCFERLALERPPTAGEGELVGTNFERKYRAQGRSFHGMTLRRRSGMIGDR